MVKRPHMRILAFLISFTLLNLLQAADSTSTSFLPANPGARTMALGGSQAAASGSVEYLFSNPASLAALKVPELWLTHHQSFIKSNYETIGLGLPTKNNGLAVVAQYFDDGKIERVTSDAATVGDYHPYTALFQVGGAHRFKNHLLIGVSGKGWSEHLDQTVSQGWAVDAGAIVSSLLPFLDVGVVGRNLGPAKNGFELPRTVGIGAVFSPTLKTRQPLNVFTGYDFVGNNQAEWKAGIELTSRLLALRAGYHDAASNDFKGIGNFSLGAGFHFRGWGLDYAWKAGEALGDEHYFSLTLALGLTPEEKVAAANALDNAIRNRVRAQSAHHFNQGREAARRSEWEKAVGSFRESLVWDPENKTAQGELQKAQECQRKAEASNQLKEGLAFMQQGRWIDATLHLNEAAKRDPENPKIGEALGKARSQIEEMQKMNSQKKNSISQGFERGLQHYIDGEFDQAYREWTFVMAKNPQWPSIQEYAAKAQAKTLERRLEEKDQVSSSKSVYTLSQNAYTYYTLGNTEEAILAWKKILVLEPQNADAKWALKEAQEKQNLTSDDSRASVHQRRVQELNSDAFRAYSEGHLKQALNVWNAALTLDPRNLKIKSNIQRVENELMVQGSMR